MKNKNCLYDKNTIINIQILYILGSIIWILIFFWIKLYFKDHMSWIFLFIPLIVFVINFINVKNINIEVDNQMLQGNYLSFCLLIVVIIINWNNPYGPHDKLSYFRIILVAFILIMLSLIDLWVSPYHINLVRHFRTILLTSSMTLLALVLYFYFTDHLTHVEC